MTRQEIERMAKLEERNAELARENAELRKKQSGFTNGSTSNLNGIEAFFMNLVNEGKLQQMPANYDCATLKMYISHLERENAELKARLEKAEKALGLACCEMALLDICCQGCDNEENCRTMFLEGSYKLKTNECEKYWLNKAEQRLAELKGGCTENEQ